MKYCWKCGKELSEDAIFCNKCGTEQKTEFSAEETASEVKPTGASAGEECTAPNIEPATQVEPEPVNEEGTQKLEVKIKRINSNLVLGMIALVLLFVCILAGKYQKNQAYSVGNIQRNQVSKEAEETQAEAVTEAAIQETAPAPETEAVQPATSSATAPASSTAILTEEQKQTEEETERDIPTDALSAYKQIAADALNGKLDYEPWQILGCYGFIKVKEFEEPLFVIGKMGSADRWTDVYSYDSGHVESLRVETIGFDYGTDETGSLYTLYTQGEMDICKSIWDENEGQYFTGDMVASGIGNEAPNPDDYGITIMEYHFVENNTIDYDEFEYQYSKVKNQTFESRETEAQSVPYRLTVFDIPYDEMDIVRERTDYLITDGVFTDTVTLTNGDTALDNTMNKVGYSNYTVTYTYDLIGQLVKAELLIDGNQYVYYFYCEPDQGYQLIYRIGPDGEQYSPEINEFMEEILVRGCTAH